jgi:hypothetical protein
VATDTHLIFPRDVSSETSTANFTESFKIFWVKDPWAEVRLHHFRFGETGEFQHGAIDVHHVSVGCQDHDRVTDSVNHLTQMRFRFL